jgi:hypothetical protein
MVGIDVNALINNAQLRVLVYKTARKHIANGYDKKVALRAAVKYAEICYFCGYEV